MNAQDVRPYARFWRSLAIQGSVIHALLMREIITRFGRHNIGVLWLVFEPMLFTLGVTALWSVAGISHGDGSIPVVAFAVTGYSSVLMWRNSAGRCSGAVHENINLLYHRNVRVIDVIIARLLVEIMGTTGSFLTLACFFMSIGWLAPPVDLGTVIAGWLMLAWFGASLGLTVGSLTAYSRIVDRIWHPTAYLMFPLSGAAFMVDWLPRRMQNIVLYMPMVHGLELVRHGYFGNVVRPHFDLEYMTICCLVLTFLGLFLSHDVGRRVETE